MHRKYMTVCQSPQTVLPKQGRLGTFPSSSSFSVFPFRDETISLPPRCKTLSINLWIGRHQITAGSNLKISPVRLVHSLKLLQSFGVFSLDRYVGRGADAFFPVTCPNQFELLVFGRCSHISVSSSLCRRPTPKRSNYVRISYLP